MAGSQARAATVGQLLQGLLGGSTFAASSAPAAVTQAAAAQPDLAPELQVTWAPSTSGSPATAVIARLYSVANGTSTYLAYQSCTEGCTSMTFRYLTFGTTYQVGIYPTNGAGAGPITFTPPRQLVDPCPGEDCVNIDSTSPLGPVTRPGAGFLHSLYPVGNDAADLAELSGTMWRSAPHYLGNGVLDWSSWGVAQAEHVPTMLILSDLWGAETNYRTPWSNWTAYSNWVVSTVRTTLAQGHEVDFWEVYNEPGVAGYYNLISNLTVNPTNLLKQFLVTYDAIKSADPTAQIVGPSLSAWYDTPGTTSVPNYRGFDMETFLNYAAANNLQLAGVSWHFTGPRPGIAPTVNSSSASQLQDEVAEAHRMIAARPSLGNPKILVNEYGMAGVEPIPGWDVSMLSALTNAGVDSGVRACWPSSLCGQPDLDGLLATDGKTTYPDYWVRQAYALMSGETIESVTSSDSMGALGSYDASTGAINALVGRGVGCNQDSLCASPYPSQLAAPEPVKVEFTVPWATGNVHVSETDIPGQSLNAMGSPPVTWSGEVPISPTGATTGTVTVTIPAFADGDAYRFTLSAG